MERTAPSNGYAGDCHEDQCCRNRRGQRPRKYSEQCHSEAWVWVKLWGELWGYTQIGDAVRIRFFNVGRSSLDSEQDCIGFFQVSDHSESYLVVVIIIIIIIIIIVIGIKRRTFRPKTMGEPISSPISFSKYGRGL